MRRKKTFILLEILIGLALASLVILPSLSPIYRQIHRQKEVLFQEKLTLFAQERLCELERAFYALAEKNSSSQSNPFPKDTLDKLFSNKTQKTIHLSPKKQTLTLSPHRGSKTKKWERHYKEEIKLVLDKKKESEEARHALITLSLKYSNLNGTKLSSSQKKPFEFSFTFLVQKKSAFQIEIEPPKENKEIK